MLKELKIAFYYVIAIFTYPFFKNKLKKLIKDENEVIITVTPHWGDIIHGLLYIDQFKKETGKKVTVYVDERFKEYVELYNVDKIITYKTSYLKNMYVFYACVNEWYSKKGNRKIIATPPAYAFFKGHSMKEVMRDFVYKVKHDVPSFPNFKEQQITSIPDFEQNKDKIIVFNPYSNSTKSTFKICQAIADSLKDEGYILYTNVIGKQKVLKGTLPLRCSMYEFNTIAQKIKMFVSVRSGIVDTLYNTNAKVFIIYNHYKWFRNFYSVKNIRTKNVQEIYEKGKNINRVLNVFYDFLEN